MRKQATYKLVCSVRVTVSWLHKLLRLIAFTRADQPLMSVLICKWQEQQVRRQLRAVQAPVLVQQRVASNVIGTALCIPCAQQLRAVGVTKIIKAVSQLLPVLRNLRPMELLERLQAVLNPQAVLLSLVRLLARRNPL